MGERALRFRIRAPVEFEFRIHARVEYEEGVVTGSGTTANVSISGVRVATRKPLSLAIGSGLTLRFSFFAGSFDTQFPAFVVRHTPDGFAAQFDLLDDGRLDLLRQALPVRGA